jgi:hypothetical protein
LRTGDLGVYLDGGSVVARPAWIRRGVSVPAGLVIVAERASGTRRA